MDEPRYCQRCAREVEPGDAYCAGCGTAVPRMTGTPVTQEFLAEQQKAKELADAKGQMYYGCGIMVAIAFFVFMYVVFGYR